MIRVGYNSRRAMSVNQMFIYISSLVVLGLLLYFGMQAIGNLRDNACSIQLADTVSLLETNIRQMSTDFGSRRQVELRLPCGATAICFADYDYGDRVSPDSSDVQLAQRSQIAASSYGDNVSNIFLLDGFSVVHALDVPSLAIEDGVLCIESTRPVLSIEGVGGRKARVFSAHIS